MKINISGVWKPSIPHVNVGGVWKQAYLVWTNVGGVWKKQVIHKPTITTQPRAATIKDNQTHTFSVVADAKGGTLRYQWYRNGSAIGGATGSSYTAPRQSAGSYRYKCLVSNEVGSTWTSEVTLTVQVSWTATHTLNVGYSSSLFHKTYGFQTASGNNIGALSPASIGGHSCFDFYSSKNDGRAPIAWVRIKTNTYRRLKISWDNGRNSATSNVTHAPGRGETAFEFRNNNALHNYLAANNGRGVKLRVEFV